MDEGDLPRRVSQDIASNEFGHSLLDMCKSTLLRIINGRYHQDAGVGAFTCHTPTGHSVVDYLIGNVNAIDTYLTSFAVGDMSTLSTTHCPLLFTLSLSRIADHVPSKHSYKLQWDNAERQTYIDNLCTNKSIDSLQWIMVNLDNHHVDINMIVNKLTEVISDAALPFKREFYVNNNRVRRHQKPPWNECEQKQSDHTLAWSHYKRDHTELSYIRYQTARRAYTNVRRYHQSRYRSQTIKQLCVTQHRDPRRFWQSLRGRSSKRLCSA